jgi:4-amino-4-deoxy-L-arabinose transferase-like glycosyltransferase
MSAVAVQPAGTSDTRRRAPAWLAPVVLAVPFLATVIALRGMTEALPIFHGSDELVYQYPTILAFSHQLPFPDLHAYRAAQTPLFHLLMAYAGKVVGYALWRLRLLQVLISYGLVLAVFRLLRRRLGLAEGLALALALLFALSPYVFGQSFRLVTDNLALLFVVLSVERLEHFREARRPGSFAAACVWIAAALLTRQSTAFLLPLAVAYALAPGAGLSLRARAAALTGVALAAVPVGLLFLDWHGLVPVGGDPSSCGLCPRRGHGTGVSPGGLELPSAELALATIGLYGAVIFLPEEVAHRRRWRERRRAVAAGLVAGALLLILAPARPGDHAAGALWNLAGRLPAPGGSSLLFWVLVPLAGAVLAIRVPASPRPWLTGMLALCFIVSAVAIRYPWQKYVDPITLLVLLVSVAPGELRSRRGLAGVAVLALAFVAYAVDTSSHRSLAPPPRSAPTRASDSSTASGRAAGPVMYVYERDL